MVDANFTIRIRRALFLLENMTKSFGFIVLFSGRVMILSLGLVAILNSRVSRKILIVASASRVLLVTQLECVLEIRVIAS